MSCDGTDFDWIAALDGMWKNAHTKTVIFL